ncbi:MAG: hypothetical protein EOM21_19665 [Gammaproteobacteria bacterium]|nr:hypothetical protein [Gammaproteobacteria bacterium]
MADQENTSCDPEELTRERARYWLRAAEWSAWEASALLQGCDPRAFLIPEANGATHRFTIDAGRWGEWEWSARDLLEDIRHVHRAAELEQWDTWTPEQWLGAARKARVTVPTVLANAFGTPIGAGDKPLRPTERKTLLLIIEALARHANINTARHEAAGAKIERLTDLIGAHVDAGTIARHLKGIPDAIEARAR